jgi:uncharacterized protein (DUF302 family)
MCVCISACSREQALKKEGQALSLAPPSVIYQCNASLSEPLLSDSKFLDKFSITNDVRLD